MSTLIHDSQTPRIFNPDDYLKTAQGRVFTAERNAAAWEQIYADLESLLCTAVRETCLYVVVGVQGSGKTTWIRSNYEALGVFAVFIDAALPARRHRARVVALTKRFGVRAVAVWINTPIDQALAQNVQRPIDEMVPEFAIRSVFGLLEAPSVDEGFDEVMVVTGTHRKPEPSSAY